MTDALERFDERAAVREFCGLMTRHDAEVLAVGDVALEYGWGAAVAVAASRGGDGQASEC